MTRSEIRELARGYIDEYTEEPEGIILDSSQTEVDINNLINISIDKVAIDLYPLMPEWFRKSFLISLQANKSTYNISGDLSVNDCWRILDIYHNEDGKKPQGLLFVEYDQIQELGITVGETGTPKCWTYEEKDTIGFYPTPDSNESNRFKAYYIRKISELTEDDQEPDLPKETHILIAIDTAKQILMIGDEDKHELNERYQYHLLRLQMNVYSITPSMTTRRRLSLGERIR